MASSADNSNNLNLTSKISDLKRFSEEKKSQSLLMSASTGRLPTSPARQTATPLLERPASRLEITALERELEEKVRLVMDTTMTAHKVKADFGSDFRYQPQREQMQMFKERMLIDFGASLTDLEQEPWLDSYIKCECLKGMCDEVLMKFSDMLGVNSNEMGNVARKLRLTYKQSFEQMAESWKSLRKQFLHNGDELLRLKSTVNQLTHDLEHKEGEITKRFDKEMARINQEFNMERDRDREKLLQAEYKMDQMSDTLKYLNGIFRTMQNDSSTMKNADLQSLVAKLERENKELKRQNNDFDIIRAQLAAANDKVKKLEGVIKSNNDEMTRLTSQLTRREEVVKQLMEREALRNAEVEKLQKISKMKDDELLSLDMKDPATSVLCIKCKKSLDDMTNIRNALMPDGNAPLKVQCEHYRILLPNLRGRKPNRSNQWIRHCIRSILIAKMKENVSLHYLKGESSRFPSFVYTWFTRSTEGLAGAALTKLLIQCDEDRWGLYYGVKAMSKDDPECSVFWSLLDETFGQDGLHFILYCLSVILSISGTFLLQQFSSSSLHRCASVENKSEDDSKIRKDIWIEISTAKEAVKLILTRALTPHIQNAIDAIDALKVRPSEIDLCFHDDATTTATGAGADGEGESESKKESGGRDTGVTAASGSTELSAIVSEEPTHISLFMWLRVMMQQLHADQIHRSAAIRLMFETASVGALTPAMGGGEREGFTKSDRGGGGGMGSSANHVEYPQFLSICLTLFPHVPITEIASLYAVCHRAGKGRVTSEIFTREADWKGYFSQSMVLPTLPLIRHLELYSSAASQKKALSLAHPQARGSTDEMDAEREEFLRDAHKHGSRGRSREELLEEANRDEANRTTALDRELLVEGGGGEREGEGESAELLAAKLFGGGSGGYNKRTHFTIRSKLATLVHRKYASLSPSLKYLIQDLPEQWKVLLREAMETVRLSLDESFKRLKVLQQERDAEIEREKELLQNATGGVGKSRSNDNVNGKKPLSLPPASTTTVPPSGATPDSEKTAMSLYLDGIQPYLAYRRLISLASLARSVNENPMLPSEIFSPSLSLSSSSSRNSEESVSKAIVRVERLLSHLEQSLLVPYFSLSLSGGSSAGDAIGGIAKKFIDKYMKFETVRKTLVARRLQTVYRKFVNGSDVAVPRCVRMLMTPGYLSNNRREKEREREKASNTLSLPSTTTASVGNLSQVISLSLPLKQREIYHEPWWVQTHIAGIYTFKLNHDHKAACLGLEPISLPRAIVAYHYYFWGTSEIAEREIHDLFVQVKAYRFSLSRCRLFAAFLGDGKDLDEQVTDVLKTPQALAVYFHLLLAVHRELFLRQQRSRAELSGMTDVRMDAFSMSGMRISTLFPTLENSFTSKEKKDAWLVDPDALSLAAKAFTDRIPWIGRTQNGHLFTEIPEKLKADLLGRVEVDDFLYLSMIQWAKLEAWHLKRSMTRVSLLEKSLPSTTTQLTHQQSDAFKVGQTTSLSLPTSAPSNANMMVSQQSAYLGGAGGGHSSHGSGMPRGRLARQLSVLPLTNLRAVMDSVYRANNAAITEESIFSAMSDSQHYATSYVASMKSRRNHGAAGTLSLSPSTTVGEEGGGEFDERRQRALGNWDAAMIQEMTSMMRDCVLWDTSMGITSSPLSSTIAGGTRQSVVGVPISNGTSAESQVTISTFSLQTGGAAGGVVSFPMSAGVSGVVGALGGSTGGAPASHLPLSIPPGVIIIDQPSFVEERLSILKVAFTAYMNPFNAWLAKLSEEFAQADGEREESGNGGAGGGHSVSESATGSTGDNYSDLRQRIQSIRIHLLSMTDFFNSIDVSNFVSQRIHSFECLGAFSDLDELLAERKKLELLYEDAQLKMLMLMGAISELTGITGQEFPRDSWHSGIKTHLDRAFVYSIHTKNSIQ